MSNNKTPTGENLHINLICECGNNILVDDPNWFCVENYVTKICDCGEEFCESCEKEVEECATDGCENTFCSLCRVGKNKICEDCEVRIEDEGEN